jgi:hypothetical protein
MRKMMDEFGRLPNDVINQIKDFYQTPIFSLKESDDNYNYTNKWVLLVITYPDKSYVEFDLYTDIKHIPNWYFRKDYYEGKYIDNEHYDKVHNTVHGKSIALISNKTEIEHVKYFIEDMETDNIYDDYMYESHYYYCGDSNDSSDEEPPAMRILFNDQKIIIGHLTSSHKIVLPITYKDELIKVFKEYLAILNKYPTDWE